jgi:hypothetical protein
MSKLIIVVIVTVIELAALQYAAMLKIETSSAHHPGHVDLLVAFFPIVLSASRTELVIEMVMLNVLTCVKAGPSISSVSSGIDCGWMCESGWN